MAKVFLNDTILDADAARIDPGDTGLLHGMGLFETLRVYHRVPFRISKHLDRLFASAAALGLPIRHTREQIVAAASDLLDANDLDDARMRITATAGPAVAEGDPQPTLLITVTGQVGYPAHLYEQGMAVAIAGPRVNPADPMAGHKTLAYWPRMTTLRQAHKAGFGEALWFTLDGHLSEGCISNVFIVTGGRLITPPASTPCLPGVTRGAVMEVAAADGIDVAEAPITHRELLDAEEVLLTASTMEVMPVVLVERKPIPAAAAKPVPGPMARTLHKGLRRLIEQETRR
ncbi:MAG: D-alanine aminotransferase [Phycisphaerae bacterium]|nr:D-alanine aminotransferase [Phycisphaerae bacterium]